MQAKGPWALLVVHLVSGYLLAQDVPSTHYDKSTQSWTLQSSAVKAAFHLSSDGLFLFDSFSTPDESAAFLPAAGAKVSPIRLTMDGQLIDPTTPWTLVSTYPSKTGRNGMRRTINLRNDALNVQVTVIFEIHPGQPFLRYYLVLTNKGQSRRVITSANLMNWTWDSGGREMRAFWVHQYRNSGADFFLNPECVWLAHADSGATVYSGSHADHATWLALESSNGY